MVVVIGAVRLECRHEQDQKHELKHVVELVHINSTSPFHVTDMHVKMGERRFLADALAWQVGQGPAVNQVSKYECRNLSHISRRSCRLF